jgi:hypothetical protein
VTASLFVARKRTLKIRMVVCLLSFRFLVSKYTTYIIQDTFLVTCMNLTLNVLYNIFPLSPRVAPLGRLGQNPSRHRHCHPSLLFSCSLSHERLTAGVRGCDKDGGASFFPRLLPAMETWWALSRGRRPRRFRRWIRDRDGRIWVMKGGSS